MKKEDLVVNKTYKLGQTLVIFKGFSPNGNVVVEPIGKDSSEGVKLSSTSLPKGVDSNGRYWCYSGLERKLQEIEEENNTSHILNEKVAYYCSSIKEFSKLKDYILSKKLPYNNCFIYSSSGGRDWNHIGYKDGKWKLLSERSLYNYQIGHASTILDKLDDNFEVTKNTAIDRATDAGIDLCNEKIKSEFKKGDYIVLLRKAGYCSCFPPNYCFKQREDYSYLRVEKDIHNSEDGWSKITYSSKNKNYWRYATKEEIAEYNRLGKPYDVSKYDVSKLKSQESEEEKLLKEANKRYSDGDYVIGCSKGCSVNNNAGKKTGPISDIRIYDMPGQGLTVYADPNVFLYCGGEWAEVIEYPEIIEYPQEKRTVLREKYIKGVDAYPKIPSECFEHIDVRDEVELPTYLKTLPKV